MEYSVMERSRFDMCALNVGDEICPEMHALAKMAEVAINRQNRQTINKNSNEMAKGPFAK